MAKERDKGLYVRGGKIFMDKRDNFEGLSEDDTKALKYFIKCFNADGRKNTK